MGGGLGHGSKVAIVVEFEAHEGKLEELRAALVEHARLCRQLEPGCLRFEVFTPVSRDGTPEANKLWVNELYEGEAAVAAHEGTDRMQALLPRLQGLCKSLRLVHGLVAAETVG